MQHYRLLAVIYLLLATFCSSAQLVQPDEIQFKTYHEIVAERESYFRDQLDNYGQDFLNAEGSEFNEFEKWKQVWGPRIDIHGSFEKYFEYEQKMFLDNPLCDPLTINDEPWMEIGPVRQPGGPWVFTSNGGTAKGIGTTEQLTFAKGVPQKMLVSSLVGGLWYSSNAGNDWANAGSDSWPQVGCISADFHPVNHDVWVAASSNSAGGWMGYIGGVQRTLDGGATWQRIGDYNNLGWIWNALLGVKFDPEDGNRLFVNSHDGLYLSTDALSAAPGWVKLPLTAPPSVQNGNPSLDFSGNFAKVWDFEFRKPTSPPGVITYEMFATVQFRGFDNMGDPVGVWSLMRSTDGGNSWFDIPMPVTIPEESAATIEMTAADRDILTLLVKGTGIYQYDISTGIWTSPLAPADVTFGGGHGFAVSASDPSIIYYSRIDRYNIYDNGVLTAFTSLSANKFEYHVDIEDFVSHPTNPSEVWMCNHGGVARSLDYGQTWETKTNGMAVAEVMDMMSGRTDASELLIATYHDGSSATVGSWYNGWQPDFHTVTGGDGVAPLIDRCDPNHQYTNSQGGSMYYSDNAGLANSFNNVSQGGDGWNATMGQHATDEGTFYWADSRSFNGVYGSDIKRTLDYSATFEYISEFANHPDLSPVLTENFAVVELEEARTNNNWYYALILDQIPGSPTQWYLMRTTRLNSPAPIVIGSWDLMPLPYNDRWIGDIEVDPNDEAVVYVVYTNGGSNGPQFTNNGCGEEIVYRMDYSSVPAVNCGTGVNCEDLTYNLPATSTTGTNTSHEILAIEQGADGNMYLATRSGAYFISNKTIADGTYWRQFGTDIPFVKPSTMEINYDINRVRMGTKGRGVWEHNLQCPSDAPLVFSSPHQTDEFYETKTHVISSASIPAPRDIKYRAGNYVLMKEGFYVEPGAVLHAFIHKCDAAGNSFKVLPVQGENDGGKGQSLQSNHYSLTIFPNPTTGQFTLELDELPADGYLVEVYDLTGKLIWKVQENQSQKLTINLEEQPDGIYMVRLTSGETVLMEKVVKQ